MANLLVRNIDDDIVSALKARAGKHGLSMEAEHRLILEQALLRKKSFAQVMLEMPNVGEDGDFERIQTEALRDVFD